VSETAAPPRVRVWNVTKTGATIVLTDGGVVLVEGTDPTFIVGAITGLFGARSRIAELEAALKPFAKRAELLEPDWRDHESHWHPSVGSPVTVGDLRRAAAALPSKAKKEAA
jgi:hypothetical protein